jgi:hypothetical protein
MMSQDQRRAIKSTIERLGKNASAEQVVEFLQGYDMEVSKHLVIQVQSQMRRDEARSLREQAKQPPQVKSRNRPQQRKIPRRG